MAGGIATPEIQRALVLQGAVALGAFEAGVVSALYQNLRPVDPNSNNVFDIIAGTSAGAINAAIIVSHAQNHGWRHATDKLVEYWTSNVAVPTPLSVPLSPEATRKYYSTKYFLKYGIPTVCNPLPSQFPQYDWRFLDNCICDPINNLWFRYDNSPLVDGWGNISTNGGSFIEFPINADFPNPRLLAVTSEVLSGRSKTFDSYTLPIEAQHIMASSSMPIFYDYQDIGGIKYWDGGILSNTPLRELINSHQDYWSGVNGGAKIPKLEVYIVDVWPREIATPPSDHDGVKNRLADIMLCDKTDYDQKAAFLVSDFIRWVKEFADIPNQVPAACKAAVQARVDAIMAETATIPPDPAIRRTLSNIIAKGVILKKVVTIQRKFDLDSVSNKWTDWTRKTIQQLIDEGMNYTARANVTQLPPP